MIQYILECIAFQLVFLLIYDLFLKKETFFQWNRVYLMGTYMVSLVLPWIKVEAFTTQLPENYSLYPEVLWDIDQTAITPLIVEEKPFFSISLEYAILFLGMGIASMLFGYKLFRIYRLRTNGELRYFEHFTRVVVKQSSVAFSFFKTIFLGDQLITKEHQSIIEHELVHIKQKHSLDLMFFELMRILCWFNPLVYAYQSKIAELHEFIADSKVAKTSRKEHYQLLLAQVFNTQKISFINQFSKKSLIKKRIVMLQKSKSNRILSLKYLLLVPFVLGMLFYTSCEQEILSNTTNETEEAALESDKALIDQITLKINKEGENSLNTLPDLPADALERYNDDNTIITEEEFFEIRIRMQLFVDELNNRRLNPLGEDNVPLYSKMLAPSKAFYQRYVQRKKALQLLDSDLKIAIKASKQDVALVSTSNSYPKDYYVYKVSDIKDFTGNEVSAFNAKMDEIFEEKTTAFSSILIADGTNAVRVYSVPNPFPTVTFLSGGNTPLKEREQLSKNEQYPSGISVPFAVVDEVPVFPGCENVSDPRACFQTKIEDHVRKHFNYPLEAQKAGIQGRVNIIFTIGSDGTISNIRTRGPNVSLEEEAERIIKRLPTMIPGKQKGAIVAVPFSMPITFMLK